jgi:GntR family transcriptional regulator/GntR family frlABCD operon transcriptional regulator
LLRKQIQDGRFKEGDILPSENELGRAHGITRPTVRHALDRLLNDGFIKKYKGKGSIVCQIPDGIGLLSVRGTTSAIGQSNLKTSIIVKPSVVAWPSNFMFTLNDQEIQAGCIYFERLRFVNSVPFFYEQTFIPNINLPRFISRKLENKSLFFTLKKYYQIEVISGEQKLKAIQADKIIASLLNLTTSVPILHLERKHNTNREQFRFYSSLFCNTELYSLYGTF